jgi:hypothetical protein
MVFGFPRSAPRDRTSGSWAYGFGVHAHPHAERRLRSSNQRAMLRVSTMLANRLHRSS